MSLNEEAEEALRYLGLGINEIKAYVTLLKNGTMSANDVSRESRIPYSKVYDALESLRKKGLITQQKSRPVLYTPRPPDTALDELRIKNESERKEKEKIALESLMSIYSSTSVEEKPEIWILRGENEIISRIKNLLLNCRSELLIAMPSQAHVFAETLSPILAALREKGAKIMILTTHDLPEEALKHVSRYSELRVRKTMYGGGIVSDEREVVLLLGPAKGQGKPLAIWARHPSLAAFAKDYFAFLWNSSETVRTEKNESQQR